MKPRSWILQKISEARGLYHRLILMVGPAGSGKTRTLREVSVSTSAPLINVNLELSHRMLDLTKRQRALQLPRLLGEIVGEATGDLPAATQAGLVLLDNIEILFDPLLQQDPLRLLLTLSRNITIVAAWPGECKGRVLTYASAGHREYRRYKVEGFLVVSLIKEGESEDLV